MLKRGACVRSDRTPEAGRSGLRVGTVAALMVAALPLVGLPSVAAGASLVATTYAPSTAQLATITNGTSAAPWNEWQGDPAAAAYSSVGTGTVLPTYTPGGAQTGSGATAEPNVAVMPGANSGTDGTAPYPSGTVGTAGPLSGYCGTGNQVTASAGTPARQPNGTTLPLAPAYFPHIVRNGDGSLTGYFDYRPKDADEAVEVANSTDGGKDWTYQGEALEQNPGYCPSGDVNDDGNGHPFAVTVGGVTRLYTLQRSAGDTQGVGMLVHTLSPTASNPLNGAPAQESVGIDPDAFVPSGDGVTVPNTGGTTITVSTTGTAGSTEQLVAGGFVDLTQTPTPTASSVITCTGVGSTTLTGCTSAATSGEIVAAGDLIEQVIGYVSGAVTVPAGPNTSTGDGGLATISVVTTSGGAVKGFTNSLTGTTFNNNAPNRAYINGVGVYCDQSNANPTTKIEDCTTGPGGHALTAAIGAPITADPVIPATASMTSGLVAPDGIVGVLPSYPGAPAGSTIVMYTEKELNFYVAGTTTNSASTTFGSSIAFTPSPYVTQDLPATISASNPVTVSMGDVTQNTIVPVTCTGLTTGATDTLTGCGVPAADSTDKYSATSLLGAPGATTVPAATLALTGEGSTSTAKLFKNNEDLAVVRVAYTTDGLNFSTVGLDNGGVISGQSNGASSYSDLTNSSLTASPANLNAYATPGTPDATELRWAGSAGSIITNPDGSYGLFLSGAWAGDGDSDAFNQIFYATSTDGEHWSIPTTVVSTDYTFSASAAQDTAAASGNAQPLGISAYYSGRAYGPSVVQNSNGTLTMMFAGYRLPKTIANAGTVLGTDASDPYTIGTADPVAYRNILTETLTLNTSPVTVAVAADNNPAVTGQPVTFTATVSSASSSLTPTGTVEFTSGGSDLPGCSSVSLDSTGVAQCAVPTGFASGSSSVVASYSGDTNFGAGDNSANPFVEQVTQAATSTSLDADNNPVVTGQPVTFTANVTVNTPGSPSDVLPAGSVEFQADGSDIAGCGSVPVDESGAALCTVAAGFTPSSQTITASYSGDDNFTGSTASPVTELVNADATTIAVSASANPPVTGQGVTYTAVVNPIGPGAGTPSGTVTFTVTGPKKPALICTAGNTVALSAATASCTIPASKLTAGSSYSVAVSYSGDSDFSASAGSLQQTIAQGSTAVTVTSTVNPSASGATVTFHGNVAAATPAAGVPTGTVTFAISGADGSLVICKSADTVKLSAGSARCAVATGALVAGAGPYTVTATYSGSSAFTASTGSLTQQLSKAPTATKIQSSANKTASGAPVTFTATVRPTPARVAPLGGTVVFTVTGSTGDIVECDGSGTGSTTTAGGGDYVASCTVPAGVLRSSDGPYQVVASYSGDVNDLVSSASVVHTVSK